MQKLPRRAGPGQSRHCQNVEGGDEATGIERRAGQIRRRSEEDHYAGHREDETGGQRYGQASGRRRCVRPDVEVADASLRCSTSITFAFLGRETLGARRAEHLRAQVANDVWLRRVLGVTPLRDMASDAIQERVPGCGRRHKK
jgi:hypothetical protein